MANFYLVCGISGGGKTTLSQRIKELNPQIEVFMDTDEYYAKRNGDERIRENTYDVWRAIFDDLHKYEAEEKDVLLSTNSLTVAQRRQFIEWFPTYKHHMIWVIAPLNLCLLGNKKRYRHIPEHLLLKQWQEMEFPNPKEDGWDTIVHITNWWTNNYDVFKLKGDIDTLIDIGG